MAVMKITNEMPKLAIGSA
jgi:hypothetical protein